MGETKKHVAKPVTLMPFPFRVDIIIPYYGQYEKVSRLLESIMRYTFSNVYKIILVDDCSPNSNFLDRLADVPEIVPVRTASQLGFGGALQAGFERSQELDSQLQAANRPQHPFIVCLQSDCVIEDVNWLQSLGTTLLSLKDKNVKMVAPRTDNPMGGDPRQKGEKGQKVEDVILEDGHLSLYAFLCHRELFAHIGGFIKNYPYGYYEDEELSHRMRKFGYKQAVSGSSYIKHVGQATIRPLWRDNQGSRRIMTEENRKRCIEDIRKLR